MMFAVVAAMFVLSGAAALIYEVAWTRKLTTYFGSTLYGVATVLASFMGGLALGSYLLGGRADRLRRPLFVYGVIEIAIAVAALLFPVLLRATQPLVGAVYATGGEGTFFLYSLVRFAIVFLLLLVPTTLMGATLPILGRAVTPSLARMGRRVGLLYAMNTLGAMLGVFASGFLLLEWLGVFGTMLVGAAANVIVGIAAMVLGTKHFLLEPSVVRPARPEGAMGPSQRMMVRPGTDAKHSATSPPAVETSRGTLIA